MNKFFFAFLVLALFSIRLEASSTFVGNGGSILDGELRGTVLRLEKSIEHAIKEESEVGVCGCLGESRQCALLKSLSEEEASYCEDFVEENSEGLLKLIRDRSSYSFRWSPVPLRSEKEGRSFDAVANTSKRTITFDEDRFAKMGIADRVQVLAHEFLHLYPIQGKLIDDEGEIGPFKGTAGKRRFLDVMGAAYAIAGMKKYAIPRTESNGSTAHKNFYIHWVGGDRQLARGFENSALLRNNVDVSSLSISWFPRVTDNLGFVAGVYTETEERLLYKDLLKATYDLSLYEVGAVYRILPLNTGDRWLDSFQVFFTGTVGLGTVEHRFKDGFVELSKSKTVGSTSLGVSLQIPLIWNFWFTASPGLRLTPYKIDQLGIESKTVDMTNQYGVSYGFQI